MFIVFVFILKIEENDGKPCKKKQPHLGADMIVSRVGDVAGLEGDWSKTIMKTMTTVERTSGGSKEGNAHGGNLA